MLDRLKEMPQSRTKEEGAATESTSALLPNVKIEKVKQVKNEVYVLVSECLKEQKKLEIKVPI